MKRTLTTACLVLALVVASTAEAGPKEWFKKKKAQLRGQETSQTTEQAPASTLDPVVVQGQPEDPEAARKKAERKAVLKKAGKGCAVGGLMSLISGNPKMALQACAMNGIGAGVQARKEQLEQARSVQQAANDAGMKAIVQTKQVDAGKGKTDEALDSLVIRYDASEMARLAPPTVSMLEKLSGFLINAKTSSVVRFEGKKACEVPLAELTRRNALAKHAVENRCGKSAESQIVITPVDAPKRGG